MSKSFFVGASANKIRSLVFAILGLGIGLIFLFYFQSPAWLVYDFAQKLNSKNQQSAVGLVSVDQASLDKLAEEGVVFPLPRQIFGAVAEVAKAAQAKAVFFDIIFTEASSYGEDDDKTFADLIKKSQVPVYFPAKSKSETVKPPIAILKNQAKALGAVNFKAEADGIYRRTPDWIEGEPSIVRAVHEGVTGSTTDYKKDLQINYTEKAFPFISLYNVLKIYRDLEEGKAAPESLALMRDRIWVVGYTAPSLFDLKPMPLDHKAPGLLISATGIANRFLDQGLNEVSVALHILLVLFAVYLILFLLARTSDPIKASLWLVTVVLVLPLAGVFIFWQQSLWLNPMPLFMGSLAAGGIQFVWNFQTQWRERLKLVKSLQNTMSEEMLELIKTGEVQISRFGEEREITVLFSDLEGFTTLSEKATPAQTVDILNSYLDDVVALIFKNSGYIDKFIGDAVMVLWGAPVQQSNHAQQAFNAAVKFHDICDEFNIKMKTQNPDFKNLKTRVGLHTGLAVVGNIGAKQRHNYTAIGDCVNLASRIEGIGKNYDIELTMTEDFIKKANQWNYPGLLEVDQIIVKGKSQPTRIYTLVSNENQKWMPAYQEGLNFYYRGEWQKALQSFQQAQAISASKTMIKRCETALTKNELNNWHNGAWMYDSK